MELNGSWNRSNLIEEVLETYGFSTVNTNPDSNDVIELLAEVEADREMAVVSVLRSVRPAEDPNVERVGKRFNSKIRQLYENALQLDSISMTVERGDIRIESSAHKFDLSRILVSMVDDPRAAVIHLAELLIRMRAAKVLPDAERKILADQMLSVYTPLANKLGIWRMKWELEDLSFKYLKRADFDHIARQVDERRIEREKYIVAFVSELQSLMDRLNINAKVNGRAKHLYGIWNKMQRKGLTLEQLFDVRAVRILVSDIASCYSALGAVHASWQPIEDEWDDYIAAPKSNGYRSLHTAIRGPNSKTVEVQIRTVDMHTDCEFGVAAHWKYKESAKSSGYQDRKVRLLRQILEWKEETFGSEGEDSADADDSREFVYTFTPAGNVIELPLGSTPVDFAYSVHTEVGHRCRGAMVNGKIVPLTYVLRTGDWVEIRTVKSGGPSRDWLNASEGFTATSRAQSRIRKWFKLEEYGRYHAQGKSILEKEFNRHGLTKVNLEKLATENGYRHSHDLLTAVGMKEVKPSHVVACLLPKTTMEPEPELVSTKSNRKLDSVTLPLSVLGVENLLTRYAACCGPLPGDNVIGYVTATRGITIHRADCGNIQRMYEVNPDRIVAVDWEDNGASKRPVDIELVAERHPNLLQDITAAVGGLGLELIAINAVRSNNQELRKIYVTLDIRSADDLKKLLTRLRGVDRVLKANRISS